MRFTANPSALDILTDFHAPTLTGSLGFPINQSRETDRLPVLLK
jgi:hypothetical protein